MVDALTNRPARLPNSEREQAFVRLAIVTTVTLYFLPDALATRSASWSVENLYFISLAALLANALAILGLIGLAPGASAIRRFYAITCDIGAVTYFLLLAGEKGLPLVLFYLWITIANGFRFGPSYLIYSLLLTIAGFMSVLTLNPWWSAHASIGWALGLSMIVLCVYVLSLVRKLFNAVARAEAANVAKRRFVSNISHEMRTPLNAIINLSQLLSQSNLTRDQRDLLEPISSASQVLMQLINDVLDFSKIEAGKLQMERIPFDLHAFINGTCRLFKAQAEARGLRINATMMPDVPHALIGDPHHLRQVLINLVGNALKFTESGYVSLDITVLTEGSDDVCLRFAVRDTGIGMSTEAIGKVFQSFSQADVSTSRKFGGTGLGTAIAKQLVELMKGRIGVESAEGKGTTFWFELPFNKATVDVPSTSLLPLQGTLLIAAPEQAGNSLVASLRGSPWRVDLVGSVAEAALRTERGGGTEVKCIVAYAADIAMAQAQAADYFSKTSRGRPPLVLCISRVSASERSVCLSVGYASIIEEPTSAKLVLNAIRSATAIEPPVAGSERTEDAREKSPGLKILVADDALINLTVAKALLGRAGHIARCVSSGDEALEVLEREQYAYDLIMLDLHMPGTDGAMTTRTIRYLTRGAAKRVPIIILTADVTPEAREEVLGAGADAIVGKPINAKDLHLAISKLCTPAAADGTPTDSVGTSRLRSTEPPETPTTPAPAHCAPSVDPNTLDSLCSLSADATMIERLIARYLTEMESKLEFCKLAICTEDLARLRQTLREIRALSGTIGASSMVHACSTLVDLDDASMLRRLPQFGKQLDVGLAETRAALMRYVDKGNIVISSLHRR